MTTITLELPGSLARDIELLRADLPALLALTRELFRPATDQGAHTAHVYHAYKQIIDFLSSAPSAPAMLTFALSPDVQQRIADLLDKNGEGELTEIESAELRVYAPINQLLSLKKAQAARTLTGA